MITDNKPKPKFDIEWIGINPEPLYIELEKHHALMREKIGLERDLKSLKKEFSEKNRLNEATIKRLVEENEALKKGRPKVEIVVIDFKHKNVLTAKEAAMFLGISLDKLNRLRKKKVIPCYKPYYQESCYFAVSDLEAWVRTLNKNERHNIKNNMYICYAK